MTNKSCKTCGVPVEGRPGPCYLNSCPRTQGELVCDYPGWKPIKPEQPVCKMCEGHNVTCFQCREYHPLEKRNHYWDDIPCPSCQPQPDKSKDRKLMVPVEWIKPYCSETEILIFDIDK
jgi:hypothetical protein